MADVSGSVCIPIPGPRTPSASRARAPCTRDLHHPPGVRPSGALVGSIVHLLALHLGSMPNDHLVGLGVGEAHHGADHIGLGAKHRPGATHFPVLSSWTAFSELDVWSTSHRRSALSSGPGIQAPRTGRLNGLVGYYPCGRNPFLKEHPEESMYSVTAACAVPGGRGLRSALRLDGWPGHQELIRVGRAGGTKASFRGLALTQSQSCSSKWDRSISTVKRAVAE